MRIQVDLGAELGDEEREGQPAADQPEAMNVQK
jgi:hypothetical protein